MATGMVQSQYYMVSLEADNIEDWRKLIAAAIHFDCYEGESRNRFAVALLVIADSPAYAESQARTVAEHAGVELNFK